MAFIRAFGSYVPSRVVGNAELAARLGCEADWIQSVSGISERRYADGESVVDLAANAAKNCIVDGIEMVIVSSGSADRRFPGPAAETAARLGLNGVPAIDVPMASAGALFAMSIAAASNKRTLVIAAEKMSAVAMREPLDKNISMLFGDGAGAVLIDPQEGQAEIVDWALHSDGAFSGDLRLEFDQPLHMDGRVVILQASRKVPAAIREVLDRNKRAAAEIDRFLMHQANQNLIVRIAQALEVAPEKFYSNIERYGNTSSASMLIAAAEWNGFRPAQPVVFAAFGAGFHWGALLAVGC